MLQAADPEFVNRLRADAGALSASFAAAAVDPRGFAARFYTRLFELAPAARELFPADLQSQQEKFAQTIATIIGFVDDPAPLIAGLRQLGARHVAYGTQPLHYALVGEALLWTLDRASPGGLPDDARAAWLRLYGWIVSEMILGARGGH